MLLKQKDIEQLKIIMIKKFGKTSYVKLANDLGVSRTAIYKAKNNDPNFDKLRIKIKEWIKSN